LAHIALDVIVYWVLFISTYKQSRIGLQIYHVFTAGKLGTGIWCRYR